MLGPSLFVAFSINLFFFSLFIVLVVWMVHINSIKFPFRIVLGAPPPILSISGNIFFRFLESSGFNIVNPLYITLVGVPSFSFGMGICSITSSSLNCYKDRSFFSNLDRRFVSVIFLSYLGSILVHYFSAAVLLYFSLVFWMSFTSGTSLIV